MNDRIRITAIVGSYRKGGVIDTAVDAILASAEQAGAEVKKIHLLDQQIEFCSNCRSCTQQEGFERGMCPINDDMRAILSEVEQSDALVLASPMNFWTVTALMKRFIDRLICFAHWPWGTAAPKIRDKRKPRVAVIVASSAAPSVIARTLTRMVSLLKTCAGLLGAKTIGVLFIGLAAGEEKPDIGRRARRKARRLGRALALRRCR
jgi:multimeric flavodoxin WrbA